MVQINEKAAKVFSRCQFNPTRPSYEEIVEEANALFGKEKTESTIDLMMDWFIKHGYDNPVNMTREYLFREVRLHMLEHEL